MILVLDTATRTPVVALAATDGTVMAERQWQSRHRHGEELLGLIRRLFRDTGEPATLAERLPELRATACGFIDRLNDIVALRGPEAWCVRCE